MYVTLENNVLSAHMPAQAAARQEAATASLASQLASLRQGLLSATHESQARSKWVAGGVRDADAIGSKLQPPYDMSCDVPSLCDASYLLPLSLQAPGVRGV